VSHRCPASLRFLLPLSPDTFPHPSHSDTNIQTVQKSPMMGTHYTVDKGISRHFRDKKTEVQRYMDVVKHTGTPTVWRCSDSLSAVASLGTESLWHWRLESIFSLLAAPTQRETKRG
jgi:hypothetical protein